MISAIKDALEDIALGKMIIVIDDEDRENEGDLVMAADKITPEAVNFMATYGRGLICTPITQELADNLELPPMVNQNSASHETAFTVSIDLKEGITTGISSKDRALTIKQMLNPKSRASDFARPGHIFPLIGKRGGVLRRAGHTEASIDLSHLAGLHPSGVICEIMKEDGEMARLPDLIPFAQKHGLKIITIKDLIDYRQRHDRLVELKASCDLPTKAGRFKLFAYDSSVHPTREPHLAIVHGDPSKTDVVMVRVHSECLTGDILGSLRCDCGPQLHGALSQIAEAEAGVVVYLRQEGRGIGLINKLKAYSLQEEGHDTVEANHKLGFKPDLRDYGVGAQILKALGVQKMSLLTNNPRKIIGLEGHGLEVVERIPLQIEVNEENAFYMNTKKEKLGHLFDHL